MCVQETSEQLQVPKITAKRRGSGQASQMHHWAFKKDLFRTPNSGPGVHWSRVWAISIAPWTKSQCQGQFPCDLHGTDNHKVLGRGAGMQTPQKTSLRTYPGPAWTAWRGNVSLAPMQGAWHKRCF